MKLKPLPPLVEYLKTDILGYKTNQELNRNLNLSSATITHWRKKIGGLTLLFLIMFRIMHNAMTEAQKKEIRKKLDFMLKNLAENRQK